MCLERRAAGDGMKKKERKEQRKKKREENETGDDQSHLVMFTKTKKTAIFTPQNILSILLLDTWDWFAAIDCLVHCRTAQGSC